MSLILKSIKTTSADAVPLGKFNVLVGPNNSGKSQTLRDIRDFIATGSTKRLTILSDVSVDLPKQSEAVKGLNLSPHDTPDHLRVRGVLHDLQNSNEFTLQSNWIEERFRNFQDVDKAQLLQHLGRFWVAHLDAESRLRIASPTDCYDIRTETPANAMQEFFAGGEKPLAKLRKAFADGFGIDIALDWSAMKRWYLMVGAKFGTIPNDRIELAKLMEAARPLDRQGDGYRSFAGVVLAMLTFSNRLLLFDEPDAFLHPAQARALGRWLAADAMTNSAQLILATHSADFLWGVISKNPDATIIRLNRTESITRYDLVPSATTRSLVGSPLLSSQPVLDSLFQKGVAVCEGDPDRAIYQTVAHHDLKTLGSEDVLFIHSNGKQALKNPIEMLRKAMTPVCAIVDLDILNSAQILRELLGSLDAASQVDEILQLRTKIAAVVESAADADLIAKLQSTVDEWRKNSYTELREARKRLCEIADKASKWRVVKTSGIDYFTGSDRGNVADFIAKCAAVGLFVVPKGELESWISVGAVKGKEWNRKALEEIHNGNCPEELKKFVEDVVKFLVPPSVKPA